MLGGLLNEKSIINYYYFLLTSNGAFKSFIPNYIFIFSIHKYYNILLRFGGSIWTIGEYMTSTIAHVLHISHSPASLPWRPQNLHHCSNCIQPIIYNVYLIPNSIMSDPISCAVCKTLLMLMANTADSSSQLT